MRLCGQIPALSPPRQTCVSQCCVIERPIVCPVSARKHTFQSPAHTLSKSERAEQRIYNSAEELLDLQAQAVIPRRCKEAISEPFKGWDGDILHNTLGCPVQRGQYLIKSSQIQCFFFLPQCLSISAKWPSIIDSCSHRDQICE